MNVRVQTTANIPDRRRELTTSKAKKPAFSPSTNSPVDQILYLQRTIGNRAVQRLIKSGALQAKLRIGQPNDRYEQEANRVEQEILQPKEDIKQTPHASSRQLLAHKTTHVVQQDKTGIIQRARLLDFKDSKPEHDPSKLSDSDIEATNEYKAYMDPKLIWQWQLKVTREEALLGCRLMLRHMRAGNTVIWKNRARAFILTARKQLGTLKETEKLVGKLEWVPCTPAAPSYGGVTGIRDMSKIRIDAIADFLKSDLTAPRDINIHISDPRVKTITWTFYDPNGKMIFGYSTLPIHPKATSAPFKLKPSFFSGSDFAAGKYILRCAGLNNKHQPVVYADRDFNVLSADLTTGTAKTTTYGDLTFTKYSKTDANPPTNPYYKLDVELKFLPKSSVVCNDVAFIQAIDSVDEQGRSHHRYASSDQDARKTPSNWSIDRVAGAPSPFYITGRHPTSGATVDVPSWGKAGRGGKTPGEATLIDKPSWSRATIDHFETCAICRSGTNTGQVYGCATWGFTNTSTGKVTLMPRSFRQMPSDQFKEACAAWNTWRMTKSASTRPEEAPTLKSP